MCRAPLPNLEEDDSYVRAHAEAGRSWAQVSIGARYLVFADAQDERNGGRRLRERCGTAAQPIKVLLKPSISFQLSELLAEGLGVEQNGALAIEYLLRASSQGLSDASLRLAYWYDPFYGTGPVETSPTLAIRHYTAR